MQTVNEIVKTTRIQRGISQADLAKKLGLSSAQSVSNLERNLVKLPPKHYKRAAKALKIPVEKLVNAATNDFKAKLMNQVG